MKIMWITGMQVNENLEDAVSNLKASGGWIYTMISELINSEKIKRLIIVSVNSANKNIEFSNERLKVIAIKAKQTSVLFRKSVEQRIHEVAAEEKPEIIDVQGIEFIFSGVELPGCVTKTIQGIPFELYKYQKQLDLHTKSFQFISLFDALKFRTLFFRNIYMKNRAKLAKKALVQADYIIGRTEWDQAVCYGVNPGISYHSVNRIIRNSFYDYEWKMNKVQTHSIFTIGFSTINKGFDVLIKAFSIIVHEYPDAILYVPGSLKLSAISGKWYDRYIWNEIRKNGLENNIKFLGALNAIQMAEQLSVSHVFVSPSLNENSSNAIAEAQIVGTPVVATYTGGNITYVTDKESGLLYSQWDEFMCAKKVMDLFEDEKICMILSENERQIARERHNKDDAVKQLTSAYDSIVAEYKKKNSL